MHSHVTSAFCKKWTDCIGMVEGATHGVVHHGSEYETKVLVLTSGSTTVYSTMVEH